MKPFSPELYATNDDAKYLILAWLESKGYAAEINPDQYGIDILARNEERSLRVEVEVKHNWGDDPFKYDTLQIPERKAKFAKDPDTWFIVLNSTRTQALICSGQSLLTSPLVEVSNRLVNKGERFFQVPLTECKKVNL
jgi:hypothetical protein